MAKNGNGNFEIDFERFSEVLDCVRLSVGEQRGIFLGDWRKFLPQFNLPSDIEGGEGIHDSLAAAQYLFLECFCDRMSNSDYLMRQTRKVWDDESKRWIFFPEGVVNHKEGEVAQIFVNDLKNNMQNAVERKSPAQRWHSNAERLVDEVQGDPRKLIQGLIIEQAVANLVSYEGIGPGIANLYATQLADREIALPFDALNIRPKIDRWKAGIPLYAQGVRLLNGAKSIHPSSLVGPLEEAYVKYGNQRKLTMHERITLDSALWVLGSEVCVKQNANKCVAGCPLYSDLCVSRGHLDGHGGGSFNIKDADGRLIELRVDPRFVQGDLFNQ